MRLWGIGRCRGAKWARSARRRDRQAFAGTPPAFEHAPLEAVLGAITVAAPFHG